MKMINQHFFSKTPTLLLAFSLLVLSQGCNNSKPELPANYNQKDVIDLLKKGALDSAVVIAESVSDHLLASDSLYEFAAFNKRLNDSLPGSKYLQSGKYLLNIINQAGKYNKLDTATQRLFTQSLFYYADNYSKDEFNDTLISFFEKAILLNAEYKALDPMDEVWIYKTLGIQYNIAGDLLKSLRNYDLEAKIYRAVKKEKVNYNYLSGSLCNQAILLVEMKDFDSVKRMVNTILSIEGIPETKRAKLLYHKAMAELNTGKIPDCSNTLDKADKIIKTYKCRDKNDSMVINELSSDIYAGIGKLKLREDKCDEAKRAFRSAIYYRSLLSESSKRYYSKLLVMLGNTFMKEQNIDTAVYYYDKALLSLIQANSSGIFYLPSMKRVYAENTLIEALDAKANAFQLLYQQKPDTKYLTTAIQCYTLSFEVEKKLMQYFSYDESKLLMLNESRLRSQKAIALCYQLYQLTKDNQWAQKAFEFAEKNKAFVLLESVKRNLAANSALQNDTLYQNTQKLQLQLAYTERSLAEATGDSAKQKIQQQKAKLENDLLFANTALGRQSVAYKTVMEKEDSISAGMVSASLLNEHTGLVEFFNADTVTYAFVLNKNQPIQFTRYNTNLSTQIDSLLYFFKTASAISNQPIAYQKTAHQLYTTLQFDKIDKGWQNLIIIPDGKLSLLPFDALITNASFTVNLQQANYFINQCNTFYGYSAAILLKQLDNTEPPDNRTTIFAPVFSNNENHQQPLLYSLQEADAITGNKNTTSFVKEKATLGNFKQQFANAGILHIATHAYADTGANSNPKIEFIDSSLLLNELYAMHTNASLVVLSACETGLGKLNSSEGPISLARGFYYAGAKNVITSYWNVDDKSTAALFTSVYKNMKSNSSADAIYNAKKELIKNENGKYASPYYWAGFVHIGMPQKKESNNYWWWLLLLPVAALVVYKLRR